LRNDVAANLGVLAAAAGVALAGSGWPDIAAGAVIALWFLRSALNVMGQAWPAWRAAVKSSGERGTG
jgi:Co/Zn/Cd efflux system component